MIATHCSKPKPTLASASRFLARPLQSATAILAAASAPVTTLGYPVRSVLRSRRKGRLRRVIARETSTRLHAPRLRAAHCRGAEGVSPRRVAGAQFLGLQGVRALVSGRELCSWRQTGCWLTDLRWPRSFCNSRAVRVYQSPPRRVRFVDQCYICAAGKSMPACLAPGRAT